MPKYYDTHYEEEQDWEPVILKKSENIKSEDNTTSVDIPLNRKIYLARQQHGYTAHQMCQLLHLKISVYNKIEKGEIDVPKECIHKIRKYLNIKI